MFVHFMPFIMYVCTALLPLGAMKDNKTEKTYPRIKKITVYRWKLLKPEINVF